MSGPHIEAFYRARLQSLQRMQIRVGMKYELKEESLSEKPSDYVKTINQRMRIFDELNNISSTHSLSLKDVLLEPLRTLLNATKLAKTRIEKTLEVFWKSDAEIDKRARSLNGTVTQLVRPVLCLVVY